MELTPNDRSHTLRAKQDGEELVIPLALRGLTSYFPTRKPTKAELSTCRRFDLTSEEPEWDPQSIAHQEQEEATVDAYGIVHKTGFRNRRYISTVKVSRDQASEFDNRNSQCSAILQNINANLQDDYLINSFERNVKVFSTVTGKRKGNLTAKRLAKHKLGRCHADSKSDDTTWCQNNSRPELIQAFQNE